MKVTTFLIPYHIFEYENVWFPFFAKNSLIGGVKSEKLNVRKW